MGDDGGQREETLPDLRHRQMRMVDYCNFTTPNHGRKPSLKPGYRPACQKVI